MGKKTILVDDRDQTIEGDGVETVEFTHKGITYELDLGETNRAALDAALQPYIEVARRKTATRSAPKRRSQTRDDEENRRIREWAETQGMELPARGPIPKHVRAQYEQRPTVPEQVGTDAQL